MKDKDEIDTQAATLEEKTTLKNDLEKQIQDLHALIAQIEADVRDAEAKRDAERTKYEAYWPADTCVYVCPGGGFIVSLTLGGGWIAAAA